MVSGLLAGVTDDRQLLRRNTGIPHRGARGEQPTSPDALSD